MLRVACCASTFARVDSVAAAFEATGEWKPVVWVGNRSRDDDLDIDAWVVFGQGGAAVSSTQLALRRTTSPVVVVGGDAPDRQGADAWLSESTSAERIVAVVSSLVGHRRAHSAEVVTLPLPRHKAKDIVGNSDAMRRLRAAAHRLVSLQGPVVITGERGVGKKLVAQALHYGNPWTGRVFAVVECAELTEDRLLGWLAGFTTAMRPGSRAPKSKTGTLLLDEVADLSLPLQRVLLGAMEAASLPSVAGERRSTVRLVLTSSRALADEVEHERFLEALLSFLRVATIHVPALRERPEDIIPIARHHLGRVCEREGRTVPQISSGGLEKMMSHDWPGNVRELLEVLDRALLVSDAALIDEHDLVLPGAASGGRIKVGVPTYRTAKWTFEHAYYSRLMHLAEGNVSQAAKLAKKTRKEVYDALRRLHMSPTAYRNGLASGDENGSGLGGDGDS